MRMVGVRCGCALGVWLTMAHVPAGEPVPMEMTGIPVNGNDVVSDPLAVRVRYGLSARAANKIVEHGDSICLLEAFKGIDTPHTDWAVPYANGPVRVLWIASQAYGTRNPMELRQRADFDITILQIPGVLLDGPKQRAPALHALFEKNFRALLARDYDVIVLPSAALAKPYAYLLDRVAAKVQAGCGLVCRHNTGQWWRIDKPLLKRFHELSPLQYSFSGVSAVPARTKTRHPVTESLSLALWPVTRVHKAKADKEATPLVTVEKFPIVATGTYGKGRVVGVYYHGSGFGRGLMPDFDPEKHPYFGDYYEPVYSLYLKAVAWAARKEPRVSLTVPALTVAKAGKPCAVELVLEGPQGSPGAVTLRYRLQDACGVKVTEDSRPIALGAEPVRLALDLPAVYANGLYRLDVWLIAHKRVENWGSAGVRVEGGPTFAIHALQKAGTLGGVAKYKVHTGGVRGTLTVRGVDDADRVFHHETRPVSDGQVVAVDLKRSCLAHNRIEFTLSVGERIVGRQFVDLYVPRIGRGSTDGEFVLASYGHTFAERHLRRLMGALYREAGLNTVYANWHHRRYIRDRAVDMGLWSITGAMWGARQSNLDKELKYCPNKPKVIEDRKKKIAQSVDDIRAYGGISRVLDDETWFAYTTYQDGRMRGQQACQCKHCLKRFRAAMRKRYKTIESLNATWGTPFKSFDELRVIEEKELQDTDNPSGWLEFRQYMNQTYARYFRWVNEQHKALGPDYGAGVGAPHWNSREGGPTYRAGDWSLLRHTMSFMMAYGGPEARLFRNAYVGQPGGQKYDPPLNWRQYAPWYHVLNGADALWYYYGHAMIGNELAWRRHAQWVTEGLSDIRDGVGVLLGGAVPLDRQVRILYSSENLAMGWLLAKRRDAWNALRLSGGRSTTENTITSLLDNFLFLQPSYVTAEDISGGGLDGCKLLVLPQILNMDDATAGGIRAFVRAGGCVLADVMPATRHRYGKPRGRSTLADVFGVDLSGAQIHKENEAWYSVGIGVGKTAPRDFTHDGIWLPADVSFLGVKPTTATAQGQVLSKVGKESQAVFVNTFGKGKAMLLNFVYRDLNAETAGWHRMFGRALAQWAGLQPPARIVAPKTDAPLAYRPLRAFRRGPVVLLGSIRGKLIWSGSGPVLIDPSRTLDLSDDAKFVWTGKRHAYNLRARRYLGHVEAATVHLPSYHGRLLALLPYKVRGVDLTAPAHVTAGQVLTVRAQVVADDARPAEHVVRLEVFSHTGYKNLLYGKTRVARNGQAAFTVPFADNDRPGRWRLVVRDVMTGTEGVATIELRRR